MFYAENGSTEDLLATLHSLRAWAYERAVHNVRVASSYLEGTGPYPERLPILVLTGRFLDDYVEMIDRGHLGHTHLRSWPPGRDRRRRTWPPWRALVPPGVRPGSNAAEVRRRWDAAVRR